MDEKQVQIKKLRQSVEQLGFTIVEENITKPWGVYYRLSDSDITRFIEMYFPEKKLELLASGDTLSPKFLLIAPKVKLSWQYHHRRAELWNIVTAPIGTILSDTDDQPNPTFWQQGDIVEVKQGQRHRIIGGDDWGLVAEIWYHTDPNNPSNEEDNVRLDDDFGRTGSSDRGEATFFKE